MKRVINTFLLIFAFTVVINAQSIKGRVIDATNSEPLAGATIKVEGTKTGAIADIDGTYTITLPTSGNYTLRISFIGYDDKVIKNVEVKQTDNIKLDVALDIDGLTTDVIIVESNTSMANEQALLVEQKNSDKVQDGISEQQIKRAPDAAASDVLKRVTGISVVKDKYVFVRGTSERYNNTTLNGVTLPSTDPDKKSFSFDLFPSNLLENIIISKTFTPDQPGNYSGGLVQITTKDFPEDLTMNFSLSSSFNDNTSTKTFYNYDASEKKLGFLNLGIDNSRMLPENFPAQQLKNTNFSREQLRDFAHMLPNNWTQTSMKAPLNTGLQFSVGNQVNVGKIPVGFLASFSYKSGFSNKQIIRTDYNTDFTKISDFSGRNSEYSVLWGGLLNINVKLSEFNKISFKSAFTTNSDDETEYYNGYVNGTTGSDAFDRQLYLTKFTQRSLTSLQFAGEHYFEKLAKMNIDWKMSYSESNRKEPDIKTMTYQRELGTDDKFYAAVNPNFGNSYAGGRFFSNLNDINRNAIVNFDLPVKLDMPLIKEKVNSRIKAGVYANSIDRNFSARNFGVGYYIGMPFDLLYKDINTIFAAENFDVNKLFYDELTNESDKYNASEKNYAGYMMVDIPINKFRIIAGARLESNEQYVNTLGIIGNKVTNNIKNNDILPSLNLIYKASDKINVRGAYSQTISRPELREIAPFSYVDFVSGILVAGNSVDLHRTIVRNYDLRFEMFPKAGELVSLSLFYKKIDSPIEEVFIPTSTNRIKSFKNALSGAQNYGMELELRKNLGFISSWLDNFSLNSNLSVIYSNIDITGLGSTATTQKRRMQGQSPYMINVGLYYDNYYLGTNVNLTYNRFGDRISEVGLNGFNDIRELGRDLLDLSISKKIYKNFEAKFTVKDILNQDQRYVQDITGKDENVRRYISGTNYSLTISYKY